MLNKILNIYLSKECVAVLILCQNERELCQTLTTVLVILLRSSINSNSGNRANSAMIEDECSRKQHILNTR